MTPRRLTLHNFLSYVDATVNFDGIRVACLAGANGHGKSALLDAMTYAVWGQGRKATGTISPAEGLMRTGTKSMSVTLEFLCSGVGYRIRRGYSNRSGTLEFWALPDTNLSGPSIKVTQDAIDKTLRMSYDTFVNSAFILQGRADEFTTRSPGERKAVLSEILGLSRYNDRQEAAKASATLIQEGITRTRDTIARADEVVSGKPHVLDGLSACKARSATVSAEVSALEAEVSAEKSRQAQIEARNQQRQQADKAFADAIQARNATEAALLSTQHVSAAIATQLCRADAVKEAHATHLSLKASLSAVDEDAVKHVQLTQSLERRRHAVNLQRANANAKVDAAQTEVERLTLLVGDSAALEGELSRSMAAAAKSAELRQWIDEAQTGIAEGRTAISATRSLVIDMESAAKDVQAQIDALSTSDTACPTCGTALTPETRAKAMENLKEIHGHVSATADKHRTTADKIDAQVQKLTRDTAEARMALESVADADAKLALARKALEDSSTAAAALPRAKKTLDDAVCALDDFNGPDPEVEALEEGLRILAYDATKHNDLRRKIQLTEGSVRDMERLLVATEEAPKAQARLEEAQDRRQKALQVAEDAFARRQALGPQETPDAPALQQKETQLARSRSELLSIAGEVGSWQNRLAQCDQKAQEVQALHASLDPMERRHRILTELVTAYGRDGIQALIIEQAVPEIEQEANTLLDKLTDGHVHLSLESLRELKKGGAKETLDIRITDELGERNYEMFSGGEAFRINFALRIALAKTVARRAGAQVRTLVIDEGFGTQTSEGLERMVEAIQSVADDFDLVLVITHVEQLKNAFPVTLFVTKDPHTGSTIRRL